MRSQKEVVKDIVKFAAVIALLGGYYYVLAGIPVLAGAEKYVESFLDLM